MIGSIVLAMSNVSLFLAAAATTPDAVRQLAALATKLANMSTVTRRDSAIDPIEDLSLGPERAGNSAVRGRHIGQLAGTLGGAALGGLMGHQLGEYTGGNAVSGAVGHGVGSLLGTDNLGDLGNAGEAVGHHLSTGAGALAGGAVGRSAGGAIGAGLGKLVSHVASPEAQAAERIKKMDPASGLAHIRMMEHSGHASPSVIQAMKDTYETRRQGLQAQIQSGVPVRA